MYLECAALKNSAKLLTPMSHSSTSPATTATNHHVDLSPNSLAHSAFLRQPTLAALHQAQNAAAQAAMDLNNHGQTHSNPVLNYGATLAHFMSVPSSRLPPMAVNSSLPQVKSEKTNSNASCNTKPAVQSNQSSTTSTANGLLLPPSPKEESSTPTPGQGWLISPHYLNYYLNPKSIISNHNWIFTAVSDIPSIS